MAPVLGFDADDGDDDLGRHAIAGQIDQTVRYPDEDDQEHAGNQIASPRFNVSRPWQCRQGPDHRFQTCSSGFQLQESVRSDHRAGNHEFSIEDFGRDSVFACCNSMASAIFGRESPASTAIVALPVTFFSAPVTR